MELLEWVLSFALRGVSRTRLNQPNTSCVVNDRIRCDPVFRWSGLCLTTYSALTVPGRLLGTRCWRKTAAQLTVAMPDVGASVDCPDRTSVTKILAASQHSASGQSSSCSGGCPEAATIGRLLPALRVFGRGKLVVRCSKSTLRCISIEASCLSHDLIKGCAVANAPSQA